jgi:hypothetical protein
MQNLTIETRTIDKTFLTSKFKNKDYLSKFIGTKLRVIFLKPSTTHICAGTQTQRYYDFRSCTKMQELLFVSDETDRRINLSGGNEISNTHELLSAYREMRAKRNSDYKESLKKNRPVVKK